MALSPQFLAALRGGVLALLAAALFGISTPLVQQLGITRNVCGAPPSRTAISSIQRIVASPDIPLRVRPRVSASFMTSVRPTGRQLRQHCLQPSHFSFVTVMAITR